MAYPTVEQVDAAVPANGTPNRALTNAVLKALVTSAGTAIAGGTAAIRTLENGVYTAGRLKAAPGMDPDDCITLAQGLIRTAVEPTSPTSEGEIGDFYVGESYFYICKSINSWVRIPIPAWA